MDWQEARRAAVPFYSQYPLFYFLLTPGPLVFTVFLILRMKRKGRSSLVLVLFLLTASNLPSAPGADSSLRATSALETLVRQGQQAFESGRYGQALEKFGKAYDGMPSNAVLSHNLALCHYKLNNRGISAHLLRRSIGENPSLPEPRQALFQLEKELGLSAQVPAHSRIHPNIPFTIMIIFFNISIVFLGAVYWFRRGSLFISFVLAMLLSLTALGVFLYVYTDSQHLVAVVTGGGGVLKRIPLDEAANWLVLKQGTSLAVRGQSQEFILVRTGHGLQGWIRKEAVRY